MHNGAQKNNVLHGAANQVKPVSIESKGTRCVNTLLLSTD